MNPEVKAEWVAALRSGEYHQGTSALRNVTTALENAPATHCCLGVLCDLYAKKGEGEWVGAVFNFGTPDLSFNHEGSGVLPENLAKAVGLNGDNPNTSIHSAPGEWSTGGPLTLAELNDGSSGVKYSFNQIADLIEREF